MIETVLNQIDGVDRPAAQGGVFDKFDPATGQLQCRVVASGAADVAEAVAAARHAQVGWARTPPVQRGALLYGIVEQMLDRKQEFAAVVSAETGKSPREALGETEGAAALGRFFAGEGQRLYGRTTTSGVAHRHAMTVRQPVGIAGLIVPANTPIANVCWKAFPALICGNAVVLKAAEDTPATARLFASVATAAGLSPGLVNVVQGRGPEAGAALVAHPDVGVISFTGSTAVGREVQRVAGDRLARVSLELGGKNPFVVCDDADLDRAVEWAVLSAFSNAGQRCASASRLIVFDAVYDDFRHRLVRRTERLRVGYGDDFDLGPVINRGQRDRIRDAVAAALQRGAVLLAGGGPPAACHAGGYYLAPTLLDRVPADDALLRQELFGPVATLHRAMDFEQALALANDSPYGLSACIHTASIHRGMEFAHRVRAGVAVVNGGTYGSEPHMPFGGLGLSGNGRREPGTEALDVYSELKNICLNVDPDAT